MSSGGKSRSNKTSKGGTTRNSGVTSDNHLIKQTKSDQNHNEKNKEQEKPAHKVAPTAEQLRIAQMIDNTHSEKILQEKINQVMQVTGVSTDDAIVALHDCDNDVNAAIDALLEGEDQGEWRESTKKKKKAPMVKGKDEGESNKENRKVDTRDRSGLRSRGGAGGAPRFRGRGGGRGNKEEGGEGYGQSNRRGRMTNGTAPLSRGRGARGRGSSLANSRSFQKRQPQPPGFTETIDMWGPPEKVETTDTLQIEYWDDEQQSTATTEDWDSEWTGSLDKTTVFSPSTSVAGSITQPQALSDLNISLESSNTNEVESSLSSVLGQVSSSGGNMSSSVLPESVSNVLSLGQTQQQLVNTSMGDPHSFANVVPSSGSLSQGQAIDLAALLQKAAPHSTLGRLPPQMGDSGGLAPVSLVGEVKNNLLGGITSSVGDSLNSSILPNNSGSAVVSSSQNYSPSSAAMNNSIFSNSVPDLGSSLTSGSGVGKVLGLSAQNANLTSRAKPQRSRLPHSTKIPSQAVEMPEVAMAALDMQFTGLEFGAETFDFTSDVNKPLMPISSAVNSRDPSSVSVSVSKDLSALNSTISQQPQSLGPQPIPFPSQPSERKPQSSLLSGPQRPSAVSASAHSLADLTKKDVSASVAGPTLGSLVGSVSSSHSSYQPANGAGYGSKVSFPSPPAHPYSQNASQNYSGSSVSGVSNSNYVGTSVNSNSSVSNSTGSNQSGTGYGSGFSAPSAQYQNNYVSVSSHNLTSMNASKAHSTLKDVSQQNYSDNSVNLGASLSTTCGAGVSNSAALSLSLGSPPASPIQPSKSTVHGKPVNSLVSGPPGVQRHSIHQQLNQHHQSHHHLQQQSVAQQTQQTQQLLAGHSQYVSPQQAALQGALPPPFYNVQQPAMYSFEELQVFQQRIPHMPQAPTTLPGSRDISITSQPSYSVTDANKFRTDQNSSPVPSTINQQGAAAGATYITTGNAGMPFYMYPTMPAVPNTFSQYGTPAIIQIPSNTHTGSTTTQFPGPPKIPYGGTSAYYDSMSQTQDYKSYGTGSQGQTKSGPNSAGAGTNSASDLSGYKNHLSKVGRSYDKQSYHTGTTPPFNLPGSGTNPMAANYAPMFIPTMPTAAQHHSTLMHHQLHQDGSNSAGQRGGAGGAQNKGPSKGSYSGSYWAS